VSTLKCWSCLRAILRSEARLTAQLEHVLDPHVDAPWVQLGGVCGHTESLWLT